MEAESRRRKTAKKRKRNRLTAAAGVHDLSDDLLELVLLGLDSTVCLVRAAATCKRWRRLVAAADDGAFLRRFRSLHAPQVIGTYYSNIILKNRSYDRFHLWPEVHPMFVPSSASASSDGPSSGLQLPLDFLPPAPQPHRRELVDGRGSLLLLLAEKERRDPTCMCCAHHTDYFTPDLVVCEPLSRRYQAIPPPHVCMLGAFLLDGDEDSGAVIGMENFRVLLVLYEHHELLPMDGHTGHGYPSASVFTSGTDGGWHLGEKDEDGVYLPCLDDVYLAGRTGGRIYWGCDADDNQLVVLDEHTLKFSTMANWLKFGRDSFRVVGGGDGAVRIVHADYYGGNLEVFRQPHGDGGTDGWELEMRVQLVEASRGLPGHKEDYFATGTRIIDAAEGLVFVSPAEAMETWFLSVDLETMELKREFSRRNYTGRAFPYTLPWSPVMRACVYKEEREDEKMCWLTTGQKKQDFGNTNSVSK